MNTCDECGKKLTTAIAEREHRQVTDHEVNQS